MTSSIGQRYGKWLTVKVLGKGGSGTVYKAVEVGSVDQNSHLDQIYRAIRAIGGIGPSEEEQRGFVRKFVDSVMTVGGISDAEPVALKVIETIDKNGVLSRAKREVEALGASQHPNIVKLIDSDSEGRWLAMELITGGSLGQHTARYTGKVLETLVAIRGVVDAMAAVHDRDLIHRDIKPNNIFAASDGRLVLGDFGIAISAEPGEDTRHTRSDDTMGSKSWLPAWAMHQVRPEYAKSIDVYMLGKVIYSMVSKQRNVQPQMLSKEPFDLRVQFPGRDDVELIHQFLAGVIVLDEEKCPRDCRELLRRVDRLIERLSPMSETEWASHQMRLDYVGLDPVTTRFARFLEEAYTAFRSQTSHQSPQRWDELVRAARSPVLPPGAPGEQSLQALVADDLAFFERNKALWELCAQLMPPERRQPGSIAPLRLQPEFLIEFERLMDVVADFWNKWGQRSKERGVPLVSGVVRSYSSQRELIILLAYLMAAREVAYPKRQSNRDGVVFLAQSWPAS